MKFLRFCDLVEMGVVNNRPQLSNMINNYGFPIGRKLGPNTRCWTTEEVIAWCNARPTERKPKRPPHPAPDHPEAA